MKLGKLFLRCAARAVVVGLMRLPGIGAAVEIGDEWVGVAQKLQEEQQRHDLQERVQQLEEAAAISAADARQIVQDEIAKLRQASGAPEISDERAEAAADLLAMMPATVAQQTRATLEHARQRGTIASAALPLDPTIAPERTRDLFYQGLLPQRRSRYRQGDPVETRPGWRFDGFLGAGGFGEVWRVTNRLGATEALKFCLEEQSARMLRQEGRTLVEVHKRLPRHASLVHGVPETELAPYPATP